MMLSLLMLGRCNFGGQRRHELHDVRHDQHVGDLADGRVFVLVDGNDETGFLHPGQSWMAPLMPQATYSFGDTVWPVVPT